MVLWSHSHNSQDANDFDCLEIHQSWWFIVCFLLQLGIVIIVIVFLKWHVLFNITWKKKKSTSKKGSFVFWAPLWEEVAEFLSNTYSYNIRRQICFDTREGMKNIDDTRGSTEMSDILKCLSLPWSQACCMAMFKFLCCLMQRSVW